MSPYLGRLFTGLYQLCNIGMAHFIFVEFFFPFYQFKINNKWFIVLNYFVKPNCMLWGDEIVLMQEIHYFT